MDVNSDTNENIKLEIVCRKEIDIKNIQEILESQNYISLSVINEIESYKIIKIINEDKIIGYILIEKPDTLGQLMKKYFKLIICIHYKYRSKGIAKQAMINLLNDSSLLENVNNIEAMICNTNIASQKLFNGLNFNKGYMRGSHACYLYNKQ